MWWQLGCQQHCPDAAMAAGLGGSSIVPTAHILNVRELLGLGLACALRVRGLGASFFVSF